MQSTGQYDYETYDAYGQAGVGVGAVAGAGAAAATYPPSGTQYPAQDYGYQGQQGQQPYDAATAGTASVAAAAMGLRDGMMVMVSVGFVRSLEDELGKSSLLKCNNTDKELSRLDNNYGFILHTTTDGLSVKTKIRTGE
jgi:hypothetical protein